MKSYWTLEFTIDDAEIVCELLARYSEAMEELKITEINPLKAEAEAE